MLQPYIQFFNSPNVQLTFKFLFYSSYVWIPAILGIIAWTMWITWRRAQFFAKQTHVLLEVKLPKEIFKSPRAMEFFITGLYQTGGEGNWWEKYWKGQTRPWFSLEMVSIDGGIHFFIWTRKGFKNQIEANLYSQFPGIELYEVPDYTLPVYHDGETTEMWASEFDLTKPDAFPIKTYVDYGMDKDPKEEFKIDPITPLIEFLGGIGKGHQAWIQIIIRAHKAEDKDPVTGKPVDLRWAKAAEGAIKDIYKKTKGEKDAEGKEGRDRPMTDTEKETINALERSISKSGFDTGIRVLYTAQKDIFNPSNIGGLIGSITHFNSSLNGFKPARGVAAKYKWFPWRDRRKSTIDTEKQRLLDLYKRRGYFYNEHARPYFVLNTEELATMYHFPGGVVTTPTFSRIGSKKSEAPANLPQ